MGIRKKPILETSVLKYPRSRNKFLASHNKGEQRYTVLPSLIRQKSNHSNKRFLVPLSWQGLGSTDYSWVWLNNTRTTLTILSSLAKINTSYIHPGCHQWTSYKNQGSFQRTISRLPPPWTDWRREAPRPSISQTFLKEWGRTLRGPTPLWRNCLVRKPKQR